MTEDIKGKEPEKKASKKPYPWKKVIKQQHYDDGFFEPYFKKYEPVIPEDYSDPLFEEEWGLLTTATPDWPNAGPANLNLNALFTHYQQTVLGEFEEKDWMVAILMPSGDGYMTMNCGIGLDTAFKPKYRHHTVTGHNVGVLRNQLVDRALANDDISHVFFLDSDTIMPPFAIMRLMRRDLDVVSGVYAMKAPPYVPLAIMRPRNPEGERKYNYYIRVTNELLNKIIPIEGAGAGCLMIKREVLEDVGPPWFEFMEFDHGLAAIGEDLFFFDKVIGKGYKPMIDLSIQCDHDTGHVAYPRVFFEGLAIPGDKSQEMIDTWNKNAILWSLGLPAYKPRQGVRPAVVPQQQQMPVEPEKKEEEPLTKSGN